MAFEEEKSIRGWGYLVLMIDLEQFLENILEIKVHLATERQARSSDKLGYVKKDLIYI